MNSRLPASWRVAGTFILIMAGLYFIFMAGRTWHQPVRVVTVTCTHNLTTNTTTCVNENPYGG